MTHDAGSDPVPDLEAIVSRQTLDRFCAIFNLAYRTGVAVVNAQGDVLAAAEGPDSPCPHLGGRQDAETGCRGFAGLIEWTELNRAVGPVTRICPCGLYNEMVPVRVEGQVVGRLIFGPYRPDGAQWSREEGAAVLGNIGDPRVATRRLAAASRDAARMLPMESKLARRTHAALAQMLAVLVETGHQHHLALSRHVDAIESANSQLSEKNLRLNETVDKLKEVDRLKTNFMATVSHELRTPLTAVMGYSEMLLEGLSGALNEQQQRHVEVIKGKSQQLLQMISEVLDLAKIESGEMQLICEEVELEELLREAAEAMRLQVREKRLSLQWEAAGGLPAIWADRGKLLQSLINLLSNAVKFTPRGGQVRLLARADGGGVSVAVEDIGIGVPEDQRERIFEAFHQVDSSTTREHGGTGLGLAIVRNFIEAHGGEVGMQPGAQQGSVFTIWLPQTARPPEGVKALSLPERPPQGQ